jgi:hypothetical protein
VLIDTRSLSRSQAVMDITHAVRLPDCNSCMYLLTDQGCVSPCIGRGRVSPSVEEKVVGNARFSPPNLEGHERDTGPVDLDTTEPV